MSAHFDACVLENGASKSTPTDFVFFSPPFLWTAITLTLGMAYKAIPYQ